MHFFQKLAKGNGILYWNAYEGGNTVKENKRMRCWNSSLREDLFLLKPSVESSGGQVFIKHPAKRNAWRLKIFLVTHPWFLLARWPVLANRGAQDSLHQNFWPSDPQATSLREGTTGDFKGSSKCPKRWGVLKHGSRYIIHITLHVWYIEVFKHT